MMQYYAGAYVTIAPLMCSSADQSFLTRPEYPSALFRDHAFGGPCDEVIRLHLHHPHKDLPEEIEASCWSERGWTFQEKLLSSRVIYIGESGISAHCRKDGFEYRKQNFGAGHIRGRPYSEISKDESSVTRRRDFLDAPDAPRPILADWSSIHRARRLWYDLLSSYTYRQLQFESDTLVAISGVVERLGRLFRSFGADSEYMAGFWKDDLAYGLCWEQEDSLRAKAKRINNRPKSTSWPSWSWCSINRPVTWLDANEMLVPLVDVISFDESAQHRSSLETLLVVRSWVFPFEVLASEQYGGLWVEVVMDDGVSLEDDDPKRLRPRAVSLTAYLFCWSDEKRWKDSPVSELHDVTGLIIEPADESEDDPKVYRRVGLFHVRWDFSTGSKECSAVESSFYRHIYASRETIQLV